MRPPTRSSRATADLITSGSVAPISDVGTISTQERDDEADHGQHRERLRQRRMDRDPDRGQRVEQERRGERGDADQRFGDAEGDERPRDAGGEAAAEQAAQRRGRP